MAFLTSAIQKKTPNSLEEKVELLCCSHCECAGWHKLQRPLAVSLRQNSVLRQAGRDDKRQGKTEEHWAVWLSLAEWPTGRKSAKWSKQQQNIVCEWGGRKWWARAPQLRSSPLSILQLSLPVVNNVYANDQWRSYVRISNITAQWQMTSCVLLKAGRHRGHRAQRQKVHSRYHTHGKSPAMYFEYSRDQKIICGILLV